MRGNIKGQGFSFRQSGFFYFFYFLFFYLFEVYLHGTIKGQGFRKSGFNIKRDMDSHHVAWGGDSSVVRAPDS